MGMEVCRHFAVYFWVKTTTTVTFLFCNVPNSSTPFLLYRMHNQNQVLDLKGQTHPTPKGHTLFFSAEIE